MWRQFVSEFEKGNESPGFFVRRDRAAVCAGRLSADVDDVCPISKMLPCD